MFLWNGKIKAWGPQQPQTQTHQQPFQSDLEMIVKKLTNKIDRENNNFYSDDELLEQAVYRILKRKLRGIDNPILRELATTELVQELLDSLNKQGFVYNPKQRMENP